VKKKQRERERDTRGMPALNRSGLMAPSREVTHSPPIHADTRSRAINISGSGHVYSNKIHVKKERMPNGSNSVRPSGASTTIRIVIFGEGRGGVNGVNDSSWAR